MKNKKAQFRYKVAKRVTLVSILINTLLGIAKIIIGYVGHSQALIADGIHSMADLFTDMMVLFAAKAGSHGPDQDHPYGHGRIETFFVILLAAFLILLGLGILTDAAIVIWKKKFTDIPDILVLIMAVVSIVANEILFRYMHRVGKKIHSNLLLANAWHHRGDAYSSLIVLIGAAGAMLGAYYLDALAAIVVSGMIIKMGVSMAWNSARELVDTGLNEQQSKEILAEIANIDGVRSVHQLRSRALAGKYFIDVHVQVDPLISVSEGHYIGNQVYNHIRDTFREIKDVVIHIDPENDEEINPCDHLPRRQKIEKLLAKRWGHLPGFEKIIAIRLDYLAGKLYIQLFLPLSLLQHVQDGSTWQNQYIKAVADVDYIEAVILHFQCGS